MSTTIITALFDINRENYENQKLALKSLDDYLPWFKKTLQLNCAMVIFTEQKLKEFVLENRPKDYKTEIIIQKLEEIPYYKYKDRINIIINSEEYKTKIQHPDRIECNLAEYSIIQYSKFEWLNVVCEKNPFSTDFFFWMDAGCSRFFKDFDITREFPGPKTKINLQNNCVNKLYCQCRVDLPYIINNYNFNLKLENSNINNNFFLTSLNLISGGLFGGNKDIVIFFNTVVNHIFESYLLKNNIINNEQLVLAYIWKTDPNIFCLLNNVYKTHLPLFLNMSE